jgi:hypothetical protein
MNPVAEMQISEISAERRVSDKAPVTFWGAQPVMFQVEKLLASATKNIFFSSPKSKATEATGSALGASHLSRRRMDLRFLDGSETARSWMLKETLRTRFLAAPSGKDFLRSTRLRLPDEGILKGSLRAHVLWRVFIVLVCSGQVTVTCREYANQLASRLCSWTSTWGMPRAVWFATPHPGHPARYLSYARDKTRLGALIYSRAVYLF